MRWKGVVWLTRIEWTRASRKAELGPVYRDRGERFVLLVSLVFGCCMLC